MWYQDYVRPRISFIFISAVGVVEDALARGCKIVVSVSPPDKA
jgi:hypothetical protein